MRTVIQRVTQASVAIDGNEYASIQQGLLILLGIEETDNFEDIEWLCGKIGRLRIFNDKAGESMAILSYSVICVLIL
jgi:D-tyrosyl-tRNA(Tyr) deacylase